ncbi:hypothetical protein M0R45_018331 [Rubus argutus]|uniref:Uncharacterized protein n=1 Tax=Rubus argutus TaxID=59490 RepID=A0AAW1X603_RUBAR
MAADDPVCLLMTASGKWNEEFIRTHFLAEDAETILSIPLPGRQHRDKWIWHFTSKTRVSIACLVVIIWQHHLEQRNAEIGEGADPSRMQNYWQKLW